MKALSLSLYELYLAQASEKITEMNSYHENGHDNSGDIQIIIVINTTTHQAE